MRKNKIYKSVLVAALAFSTVVTSGSFTVVPVFAQEENQDQDQNQEEKYVSVFDKATGTLTISKGGSTVTSADGDYNDAGIKYYAYNWAPDDAGTEFSPSEDVKKVVVEDGVKALPNGAFAHMQNLTEVQIPDSVKLIGAYAFARCSSLKEINLGDGTTSIGYGAFENCGALENITIGKSMETLGSRMFNGCTSLKKISVAEGNTNFKMYGEGLYNTDGTTLYAYPKQDTTVTIEPTTKNIESLALAYAPITSITIPASVETISDGAFYNCTALSKVTFEKNSNCTAIKEYEHYYGDEVEDKFGAFENCKSLTSVTFGDKLQTLASGTFRGCTGLTTLSFGKDFKGFTKFYDQKIYTAMNIDCFSSGYRDALKKFTTIKVVSSNTKFAAVNGVLYTKSKKTLCMYPEGKKATSFKVPSSVKAIGKEAFCWNANLKKVTLGSKTTTIKAEAFNICKKLTSINLKNVKKIEERAFLGSTKLANVTWSKKLTSIGQYAFMDEAALKKVTLYKKATLGRGAFYGCKKITSVTFKKGVKEIGIGALKGCKKLKSVVISGTGAKVNDRAFEHCRALKKVTIKSGVKAIGESAFTDCTSLKKVTIPKSVKKIGKYAFGYNAEEKNTLKGFKIYGKKGSAAYKYAKANKITFQKVK